MRRFGIIQGRLTPSRGRGIQFFPFDNWEKEFELGLEIGIDEIEWIFDYDRYEDNPLWTDEGKRRVRNIVENTGVDINSICFDYFMRRPFYKQSKVDKGRARSENIDFARRIIDSMAEIGAEILEVPMVDNSSVQNNEERKLAIDFLQEILLIADDASVFIGCETDMPPGDFRRFLDEIGHKRIRANYDSGNSSGLGYNHRDEILSLGDYVANVHIKDRIYQGQTVELGTGSADFDMVFATLKDIDYKGSIILQAARSEDETEVMNIITQLGFVKKYCQKYGLD